MKVISLIIRLKGMGFINGGMERYTKGIGKQIEWMEKGEWSDQMEKNMLGNIEMIKNMAFNFYGLLKKYLHMSSHH